MSKLNDKISALVTIGDEASYHCIFVAGVPMYHGMDLELVMCHAVYPSYCEKVEPPGEARP